MIYSLYNYYLTRKTPTKFRKLSQWLLWQLYKYLKFSLPKSYKRISTRALGVDVNSNLIVSLTSFPARINIVYLAIKSMLNQTQRPQKIVLWLGKELFPNGEADLPQNLLELKPFGLEIEFCDDLKAHTKYFYAMQKYPNNLVVTVDDDIIYPTNLLSTLLKVHHKFPRCVVANRVRSMTIENGDFLPYRGWKINRENNIEPSKMNFATGVGGVLYKPEFFLNSLYDLEGIRKTNCIGDDIWLKAGEMENKIPVVFTNFYFKEFIEIPNSQKENLHSKNVFESGNDTQVKDVFGYFGITIQSFE